MGFEDFVEVDPEKAKGLLQVLEYDGDVENDLCLEFVAEQEFYGAIKKIPIRPDGSGEGVAVTKENRHQYVSEYINWYLNVSIKDKFASFKKGFMRAMASIDKKKDASSSSSSSSSSAADKAKGKNLRSQNMFLGLFQPREIELLICGSDVLDFNDLKGNTEYQDGFTKDSPIVIWMWEVLTQEFSEQERRDFLMFMSGSPRAPPKGLSASE